jgi:adenylylsulfate kinase-like enzyme
MVDTYSTSGHLVAAADPQLYAQLQRLARAQRLVCFAGLPGTGKSLLSHQFAHLAHAMGRTVHMLQWDVARPVFEASPAGQRYANVL